MQQDILCRSHKAFATLLFNTQHTLWLSRGRSSNLAELFRLGSFAPVRIHTKRMGSGESEDRESSYCKEVLGEVEVAAPGVSGEARFSFLLLPSMSSTAIEACIRGLCVRVRVAVYIYIIAARSL